MVVRLLLPILLTACIEPEFGAGASPWPYEEIQSGLQATPGLAIFEVGEALVVPGGLYTGTHTWVYGWNGARACEIEWDAYALGAEVCDFCDFAFEIQLETPTVIPGQTDCNQLQPPNWATRRFALGYEHATGLLYSKDVSGAWYPSDHQTSYSNHGGFESFVYFKRLQ